MNSKAGLSAEEVVDLLALAPHPEGGFFRETYRDRLEIDGRSVCTAIYYLLAEDQISTWHRIDSTEMWHHYAGAPAQLNIAEDGKAVVSEHTLGRDLACDQRPQIVVPAGWWQSARSLGAWTLFGCTVAPGFEFAGFEMAPENWRPGTDDRRTKGRVGVKSGKQ